VPNAALCLFPGATGRSTAIAVPARKSAGESGKECAVFGVRGNALEARKARWNQGFQARICVGLYDLTLTPENELLKRYRNRAVTGLGDCPINWQL